jgi:DNA primase
MTNLDYFDVENYLRKKGITYSQRGKNVSEGWIGTRCLWCDDKTNHLGINLLSKTINCFRCPAKGTIIKYIMKMENCNVQRAFSIVTENTHRNIAEIDRSLNVQALPRSNASLKLSQYAKKELPPMHRNWLIDRNFDPDFIFKKYDLWSCGHLGEYKFRLIVPVSLNRQIVTFVARDVSNKASPPYKNYPEKDSILTTKETLYNFDSVKGTAIVVEGVTDVWRIGDGAVATLGDKWTKQQAAMLRDLSRVFILFDAEEDAQKNAEALAIDLAPFTEVHTLELESGDPAELSKEDAKELRKQIFGRVY